ncbi:MAG: SagB/ThcOx family dehydrogenase [Fidelibacterota bacterium]|nr:MAG: SagB/ThcOx family dehydrogenase [Candidatus Neomarinimicrobiota bacterium]
MSRDSLISLPRTTTGSQLTVGEALKSRISVREFKREFLTLEEVGELLWAAQGVNRPGGYRTAPSAGALYPLETLLVTGNVKDLKPGVYRYSPPDHVLLPLLDEDLREQLASSALDQAWIKDSAAVLVITAIFERTTLKYGQRGHRYVHMDVGYASENVYLQATAMGLGTVAVGAFHDGKVQALLGLPADEHPLMIMPVGKPR